ncbi:hypothetical protein [Natronospora cellulosivora (SeqCode)]
MEAKIIIKCYCHREWLLVEKKTIACACCGFIVRMKVEEGVIILEPQKPIYHKKLASINNIKRGK